MISNSDAKPQSQRQKTCASFQLNLYRVAHTVWELVYQTTMHSACNDCVWTTSVKMYDQYTFLHVLRGHNHLKIMFVNYVHEKVVSDQSCNATLYGRFENLFWFSTYRTDMLNMGSTSLSWIDCTKKLL